MECLFCNIIKENKGFKVWENSDFLLLLDINPINSGHLLLITKEHISDVFTIEAVLYSKLFLAAKGVARILKRLTSSKRIGLAVEGFGVPHVHLHLVPLNKGNELNPLRAKKASESELSKMQTEFKAHFKTLKVEG